MIDKKFHIRMMATMSLLLLVDIFGFYTCVADVIHHGPSMAILFGNEFALLLVSLASIIIRYVLNWGDLERGNAWEYRSIFLFYWDFIVDFLKLVIYSTFFGIVMAYYGVPLHIIRDLYLTVRSFVVRVRDIIRYRQATANMNERYPEATPEELAAASDRTCIICREEMVSARKLPCGHLFHFRCLRSWLERQQACPTCRRPIIGNQPETTGAREAEAAGAREDRGEIPIPDARPEEGVPQHHGGNNEDEWLDEEALLQEDQEYIMDEHGHPGRNIGGDEPLNPDLVMRGRRPPLLAQGDGERGAAGPARVGMAGPAIVFPQLNQQHSITLSPTLSTTAMTQIPGTVVPSPFGTIPVILIPPEQIAPIVPVPNQEPPPIRLRPTSRHVEARSTSPDRSSSPNGLSATNTSVPQRPHSAAPATDSASAFFEGEDDERKRGKNLYVLKTTSSSGSLAPTTSIVLESIGAPVLGDPSPSMRRSQRSSPSLSRVQPPVYAERYACPTISPRSRPSASSEMSIDGRLRERSGSLRSSVQGQLQRELESLTQLQEEIASLTDRILAAQDKISSLENVPDLNLEDGGREERDDPSWGKQRQ